ncbi:uncharacterized protein A1O9_06345 [Exophiala aquamarina CBS 119918]|uniref:Uncharacterized protein n=1 Tax=Exophiala aquamarina CBS 119918 TaxID=1182545 RepID=A0A072PEA0_9EURO|nr:uncharacterized protein A1O9_06345 [Exophiala aquamarina CBS 119918]KEF58419.1 hypothetical protein A1O9_06345 [Exophiala aquamarina CBS 119918]
MCRICGRMVKCIFDSMPSRVPSQVTRQTLRHRSQTRSHHVSAQSLVHRALNISKPASQPPTFLLPFRAKLHQASSQPARSSHVDFEDANLEIPPTLLQPAGESSPATTNPESSQSTTMSKSSSQSTSRPLVLSKSLQELLPKLHAQKPHYITAHVHRFPYLLTEGDILRLPFHMKDVHPGDVLRLNRASIIGSRDYTLKAGLSSTESYDTKRTGEPNYLDERLFELRLRVMGLETGPMMEMEKKKRRNRHRKVVHSKHKYTMLRVMQIKVKSLDELRSEKGTLLLES